MAGRRLLLLAVASLAASEAPYQYSVAGDPADFRTKTKFAILLSGGGGDVDDAFRWWLSRAGNGDAVVLRASGSDGYNRYLKLLSPVNSVESIVIKTPEAARAPFVADRIRQADALFIAGGDQWNYVRTWRDTPVDREIHAALQRGVPIGGTSAGLAVLGEYAFSAEHDTVQSAEALANPYDTKVTIARGFLRISSLAGVITDSHFSERDRMGRLLVFIARIAKETGRARGIGIDEKTALLVDGAGRVKITGAGGAYFLEQKGNPALCASGKPLDLTEVSVYRLKREGTFNLRSWRGSGGVAYRIGVKRGVVTSDQPGGSIY